jgi:hypothetical protein
MHGTLVALLGAALILLILRDAFEALVLPQTVNRRLRPARFFYRWTWSIWARFAQRIPAGGSRQGYLGVYGPLSLFGLILMWAYCLVLGFAMLQWGAGSHLDLVHGKSNFGVDLYMSGTTFFTLGLGDVTPNNTVARVLTVIEAGTGFGFLALVIGYLPVLYQAFSRRELNISLLDARAGSPPTAEELLRRHDGDHGSFERLLREWERWAAELMESHLSYPVLAYYRSQHQNQSWLAALTTILDASALSIASFDGARARQARLTFAMARHAIVDLAQVFRAPPVAPEQNRLTPEALSRMRAHLARAGVDVRADSDADAKLEHLRRLYEPYVNALGKRFLFAVPAWSPESEKMDNWRTSAWERVSMGAAERSETDVHRDVVR